LAETGPNEFMSRFQTRARLRADRSSGPDSERNSAWEKIQKLVSRSSGALVAVRVTRRKVDGLLTDGARGPTITGWTSRVDRSGGRERSCPIALVALVVVLLSVASCGGAKPRASSALGSRQLTVLDKPGTFAAILDGLSVTMRPIEPATTEALDSAAAVIRRRLVALGGGFQLARQGDALIVELAGGGATKSQLKLIGQTAELTFRPVADANGSEEITSPTNGKCTAPSSLPAGDSVFPLQTTGNPTECFVVGPVLLNGSIIHSAAAARSSAGQWQVNFTTTSSGSSAFDAMAAQEYHQYVAIVLDNVIESAPEINATAFNGSGQITGAFTESQAKDLALELNYGSLPLQLVQQSVQSFHSRWRGPDMLAGRALGKGSSVDAPIMNLSTGDQVSAHLLRDVVALGAANIEVVNLVSPNGDSSEDVLLFGGHAAPSQLAAVVARDTGAPVGDVSMTDLQFE